MTTIKGLRSYLALFWSLFYAKNETLPLWNGY